MMNSFDMPFLVSRLFGVPHMLASTKLDIILNAIAPRIFEGGKFPIGAFSQEDISHLKPPEAYAVKNQVAIIPVHGTLVRRGAWLGAMSGLTSYEGLRASFREAIQQSDVRAVLLDIDSGGGEAGGVFDLVEEFRALSQQYGKPVWAHANEFACSAAYAIACAASQIWIARTGFVGSIGVVCAHLDQSRADEKDGHKWTFVFEGDHKVHGNPHEPLADKALEKMQADCALLYEIFVDLVAENRPMSIAAIRNTKAETFIGTQAIELGLADHQGTLEQALEELAVSVGEQKVSTHLTKGKDTWDTQNIGQKKIISTMRKRRGLSTSSMEMMKKTQSTLALIPNPLTMKKTKMRTKMKVTTKINTKAFKQRLDRKENALKH
ncbi:S49 family peptidase [Bartonella ancashensis]|nr:S49 family peptidase [Bartonella ancashensis]